MVATAAATERSLCYTNRTKNSRSYKIQALTYDCMCRVYTHTHIDADARRLHIILRVDVCVRSSYSML